jgi:hypothetical protein
LVELIKDDVIGEDARYGIATVQPNRALKKCRIRNLRVEYFLSEVAIFLVEPIACRYCDRSIECSDDFVLQIIEKQNGCDYLTAVKRKRLTKVTLLQQQYF